MIQVKESYLWSQVKTGLTDKETHISRIENTAGSGVSDLNACRGGVEIWVELKVFHGIRLHFRTSQRLWIIARAAVGGRVFVMARDGEELSIYNAETLMWSERSISTDRKSFSIARTDLPPPILVCRKPFKWDLIRTALFEQQ